MPRRSSNADRIARAAAEAEAAAEEKKAAKKAKKTTQKSSKKTAKKPAKKKAAKRRTKKAKAPQRMKLIWGVGKPGIAPVSHYAFRDLAAAEADAAKRGEGFGVRKIRVPMEDEEDSASSEEE